LVLCRTTVSTSPGRFDSSVSELINEARAMIARKPNHNNQTDALFFFFFCDMAQNPPSPSCGTIIPAALGLKHASLIRTTRVAEKSDLPLDSSARGGSRGRGRGRGQANLRVRQPFYVLLCALFIFQFLVLGGWSAPWHWLSRRQRGKSRFRTGEVFLFLRCSSIITISLTSVF